MKLLPIHVAGALTQPEASHELAMEKLKRENPPRPIDPHSTEAERIAAHRLDRALSKLAAATESERHDKLLTTASYLYGMIAGGWSLDTADVQRGLMASMAQNGGLAKYGEREIERCINDARRNAPTIAVEVQEKPPKQRQNAPKSTRTHAGIVQSNAEIAPSQPIKTLRRYGELACICREAVLIALYVQNAGLIEFTVAELALLATVENTTAQRWINKALAYGFVTRFADFKSSKETDSHVLKSAKRRYRLSIQPAQIAKQLPDHVQELMERGEPNVILKSDAIDAGLDPTTAERVEMATRAISESINAYEVRAKVERAAVRKANELHQFAAFDDTPFTPDTLPASPAELSAALIKALIATAPAKTWLHGDLRWIAGVRKGTVSSLIKKAGLQPAAKPTFIDLPVSGKNLHAAVRTHQKEKRGAPVAWLDATGEVICNYSPIIPKRAAGVRLNVGKTYHPATVEAKAPPPPRERAEPTPEQQAERNQHRTRRYLLPTLRGNMETLDFTLVPGIDSYFYRGAEIVPNTWETMIEVMLREGERLGTTVPTPECVQLDTNASPPEYEKIFIPGSSTIVELHPVLPTGNNPIDLDRAKQPATVESIEAARLLGRRLIGAAA